MTTTFVCKEKNMGKVLITDDLYGNKVLVTGISGFVGKHMSDLLVKRGMEVHGIVRWRSSTGVLSEDILLHDADLMDLSSLLSVLLEVKPDVIVHLASQSYVDTSFIAPVDTLMTNVIGTCNLMESIKRCRDEVKGFDPTVLVITSSEVYGQVTEDELPIKETNQFRPASPYAVSKVGQDMIALQYYLSWGIKTIRIRSFSHTGAGRGKRFALSSFARQIALIEKNKQAPVVNVGNLDSIRTLCDVRDMVRAYYDAILKCEPGEVYNISGNEHMSIKEALDMLLSLTDVKVVIQEDKKRMRPSDVTLQIPCIDKFKKATNWLPVYTAKDTLLSLLNYWRKNV